MRRSSVVAVLALAAVGSRHVPASHQEEAQALDSVQRLLTGWRTADTVAVSSVLHPQFRLVTLREAGTPREEVQLDTRERLMASSERLSPGQWDVRFADPVVHMSGDGIATVWGSYQFYINGSLSHCGIESYQLYKVHAGWQIVSFADTHHPCGR